MIVSHSTSFCDDVLTGLWSFKRQAAMNSDYGGRRGLEPGSEKSVVFFVINKRVTSLTLVFFLFLPRFSSEEGSPSCSPFLGMHSQAK